MTPEEAAKRFHWVKYDSSTNTIELFMDHHMLSWSRMCEAGFFLEHIMQVRPNYGKMPATIIHDFTGKRLQLYRIKPQEEPIAIEEGVITIPEGAEKVYIENRKPWFLDFGEYMHYMFEIFYTSFIHKDKTYTFDYLIRPDQECLNLQDFLEIARKVWDLMDMDWYKDRPGPDGKKYSEVGGFLGVVNLLTQYYIYYMDLRVRVVDTEIIFGYDREVPIGSFLLHNTALTGIGHPVTTVNCYLTGRIDLIIDNGYKIGPVDHKNTHKFFGDESENYNPQDALTGYILATRCILQKNYPKYFAQGKECLSSWVYHISACEPSTPRDKKKQKGPRFKVTPVFKTPHQLEDFKLRQLSTYKRICELLFNDKTPEWNTNSCSYMFGRDCQFKPIHSQDSNEWGHIIQDHYKIGQAWDPKERDSDKIDEIIRKQHAK